MINFSIGVGMIALFAAGTVVFGLAFHALIHTPNKYEDFPIEDPPNFPFKTAFFFSCIFWTIITLLFPDHFCFFNNI